MKKNDPAKEKEFDDLFSKAYEEKAPNLEAHINIALVGKVSSGKSSVLNAILGCDRSNPVAQVGAHSGVTTRVTHYRLDEHVLIIDCPGLDDVEKENSEETKSFLESIDLGLFVVTGSADATQKINYDALKSKSGKVIVILNMIDHWDNLNASAVCDVIEQWKTALGVEKVFGVCAKGYDPQTREDAPMDIRGIEEVKAEIFDFLRQDGKSILFARNLKGKENFAISIIGTALAAVVGEAFIPGSAAYITATQAVAITSLYYLYTGEVLSKTNALALLPVFAGESVGTTAFLWAKSFLPPTGIVDVVAASIAAAITFAMLAAVKWILESGHTLEETDLLVKAFTDFKSAGKGFKDLSLTELKSKEALFEVIKQVFSTSFGKLP